MKTVCGKVRARFRAREVFAITITGLVVLSFQACAPGAHSGDEAASIPEFGLGTPEGQASQGILRKSCSGCHNRSNKPAGVGDLADVQELVKNGFIHPGNADSSILVKSILRNSNVSAMPPADPLFPKEIEVIRTWIQQMPVSVPSTAVPETPTTLATAPPTISPEVVSFSQHIQPLLNARCNRCHDFESADGNVILDNYQDVSNQVSSGDANQSLLFQVVSGPFPSMPKSGSRLSDSEVNLINLWISDGALNN